MCVCVCVCMCVCVCVPTIVTSPGIQSYIVVIHACEVPEHNHNTATSSPTKEKVYSSIIYATTHTKHTYKLTTPHKHNTTSHARARANKTKDARASAPIHQNSPSTHQREVACWVNATDKKTKHILTLTYTRTQRRERLSGHSHTTRARSRSLSFAVVDLHLVLCQHTSRHQTI